MKLLVVAAKTSSGGLLDIVIPKHSMWFDELPHVFSDHYSLRKLFTNSYREFSSKANLTQSKKYIPPIERNNGRQRHCLAVFRRRSIVLTRFLTNLGIIMAFFARCSINGPIDELIGLLKGITPKDNTIEL